MIRHNMRGLLKKAMPLLVSLAFVFTSATTALPAVAASANGAPGTATLSSDQWSGDTDGNYNLTWNMWYGNNATSWQLYEKLGAGSYKEIYSASLADNTPGPQNGSYSVTGKTANGTYCYYITLTNASGVSTSNVISVVVGNAVGNILIGGVDDNGVVDQFTVGQGAQDYTLNFVGASSPVFSVATNNTSVLGCSIVDGNKLHLNALAAGRASLAIKEATTGQIRYVGVRVKNADGTLPGMPGYLSIGSVSEDTTADLSFWQDFTNSSTDKRVDERYIYINGGPTSGWRTWTTQDGGRAISYIQQSRRLGIIPFFVYYNIPDSGEGYALDLSHAQSTTYMEAYYKDLKFFLDICKQYAQDDTVGIVFEPDFIGYMMQQAGKSADQISAAVSAAYSSGVLTSSDPTFPNTVQGYVNSVNYIVHKYYPQAYFGWQFNLWAYTGTGVTSQGILHATENQGQTAGRQLIESAADQIASYYMGAGVTSYGANFISIDKYGLDGGALPGASADPKDSTWLWNADIWSNYLDFAKTLHTDTKLPVILWQIPVGHINGSLTADPYNGGLFPDLDGSDTHYEDSAPDYFLGDSFKPGSSARYSYFSTNATGDSKVTANGSDTVTWGAHMQEAKDSGVIAVLFGAGVNASTHGTGSPPSDSYWWINKVQSYYQSPIALDSGSSTPGSAPQAGTVSVNNASNTGSYTITCTVPSGDTATSVKLYEGSAVVATQAITTAPVSFTQSFTGKAAGSYTYKAEFINAYGSTFSGTVTVTVATSGSVPQAGTISVDNASNTGSYTITCAVPSGNTATSVKLYEGAAVVATQTVTATPASFTQAFTGKAAGSYTYRAEFINAYGSAFSGTITVTVTAGTGIAAWAPNTQYHAGDLVTYNGRAYKCLQNHTSLTGWEPATTPSLWQVQ